MTGKIKLLFCIDNFNMTGATASLVAVLQKLDYSKYDVSLYRFNTGDSYLDQIPQEVHQLPLISNYAMYSQNLRSAIKDGLRHGWLLLLFQRLILGVRYKLSHRVSKLLIAKHGPALVGEYDIAIAFCCSYMWEFVCTKVNAKKRVAWLDTDHRRVAGLWKEFARPNEWDNVVCVCRSEVKSLTSDYPELTDKVTVVHNIVDKVSLIKRADEYEPDITRERLILVTVGRVTIQKSQDLIVKIALSLKKRGIKFKWYLIGPGSHHWHNYLNELGNPDLSDCVEYLGGMANPYPYMKHCDLYVQPSRWEGWGMTVTEALACNVPVMVSDIPAFREQIIDGENGWIVSLDVKAFADKIANFASGNLKLTHQGKWLNDYSCSVEFDNMCTKLMEGLK